MGCHMNTRREAILWSIAIAAAIALGLAVVWVAIVLAFSRPNLAPLYFASAPYRQDDYSADDTNAAQISPLDPALEQEAIREDQARGNPLFNAGYYLKVAGHALLTTTPAAQTASPVGTRMVRSTPTTTRQP